MIGNFLFLVIIILSCSVVCLLYKVLKAEHVQKLSEDEEKLLKEFVNMINYEGDRYDD